MIEEDAAVAFAEATVLETGRDWRERGAIIIGREVPVRTADGRLEVKKKYILGDTFIGEHNNVIEGTFSAYIEAAPGLLKGDTISFVHTHPYFTGHNANEFSGLQGNDIFDLYDEFMNIITGQEDFEDLAYYLGDKQVTWLPGVDRMYLASPIDQKLYACDDKGPIMDSNNTNKYKAIGVFKSKIYGPPHKD